jgi:hypothetical protein
MIISASKGLPLYLLYTATIKIQGPGKRKGAQGDLGVGEHSYYMCSADWNRMDAPEQEAFHLPVSVMRSGDDGESERLVGSCKNPRMNWRETEYFSQKQTVICSAINKVHTALTLLLSLLDTGKWR